MSASDPAAGGAGPQPRSPSRYALELGETEISRYRTMAERARSAEADLWRRAGIVSGARVADVGCGPGALLPALAAAVGPTGEVTGVDADPAALEAARAYTAELADVAVVEGGADDTRLPPASLDVVMVRHVLAHNGGAETAIVAHLATLLCPGGCLYLVDADGTATRMMPEDADLADLHQRYLAFHARRGSDLRAGLRLADWLRGAGLEVVEYRGTYQIGPVVPGMRPPPWAARAAMVDAGVAAAEDVARWTAAFERLDAASPRPTFFVPIFIAIGRRPA